MSVYTYQQIIYAKRLYKLRQAYIVKDNIHLTYKYKNRNKAFHNIDAMQDRINKAIIEDKVNGNGTHPKNLEKHGKEVIHTTVNNERKRIHHDKHNKSVNHATKNNSEIFTDIFNYRRQKIAESLEDKIENELKRPKYQELSDSEKIRKLRNDYGDYGKKRLQNIIKDAMHTNESNIAFINAIENGYNYKIWMNGRSKGRTRPWHKAKHIASVPIDETFDIYGSYPARMMYPGDLNGGAENVANCKCWLNYTNRVPRTLRKKSTFKVHPNLQQLFNKQPVNKLRNTVKKPINKIKKTIKQIGNKVTSKINPKRKIKNKHSELNKLFSFSNDSNTSSKSSKTKTKSVNEKELFEKYGISEKWDSLSRSLKLLKKKFSYFLPKKYVDEVFNHFLYFHRSIKNWNVENCTIRRADGTIVPTYTDAEGHSVSINEDIREEGKKGHIHTVIHNHPEGYSAFSSAKDINEIAECGIMIHKSTTKKGTMVIKNKDIKGNKKKLIEIKEITAEIYDVILEDFRVQENGGKQVNRENPKDVLRLNQFVDKHYIRYEKLYQNKLGEYMEIKYIKH